MSLKFDHWGLPALTGFTFKSDNSLAYKPLITQAKLAKGYLVGNSVYVCTPPTPDILDGYFIELEPIFATTKECEESRDLINLLRDTICHCSFKRFN